MRIDCWWNLRGCIGIERYLKSVYKRSQHKKVGVVFNEIVFNYVVL